MRLYPGAAFMADIVEMRDDLGYVAGEPRSRCLGGAACPVWIFMSSRKALINVLGSGSPQGLRERELTAT